MSTREQTAPLSIIYSDQFLLDRALKQLNKDTDMKTTKSKQFVAPTFELMNKKTYLTNFRNVCESISRDENHIKAFIDSELRVDSAIMESGALIIDKIFVTRGKDNDVKAVLLKYIGMFVLCKEEKCKSKQTQLVRENRINFLICDACHAKTAIQV